MNNLKTFMLMAVLAAVLVGVGYGIGGPSIAIIFLVIAGVINFGMFWFSDKLVLRMSGAREVSPQEEPRLHRAVEEVVALTDLPKPKVYIIQNEAPNAFATGRSPKHAVVAATTGIMRILDERELRGVLGHEMAHIRNRDMLISTIVATFAGAITYIAYMLQFSLFFGGGRRGGGGGGALGMVALLATIILAPMAALIIRMAVSRAREYQADETGARFVHDPEALASALEKLHLGAQMRPMKEGAAAEATAHLYIVNPLRSQGLAGLFTSHPPMEKRVERLRQMARTGSYL